MLKFWLQIPDLIRLIAIPFFGFFAVLALILSGSATLPEVYRNRPKPPKKRLFRRAMQYIPATSNNRFRGKLVTTYYLLNFPIHRSTSTI